MPNNVIEVVVRTIDEATAPAREIVRGFEQIGSAIEAGIGGAVVIEGFRKFIENTVSAEQAQVRLQIAVQNSIEGAMQGAKALEEFSKTFGRSSIFSSDDLNNAQAALLRFDRVYGDTFERARKDSIDLAAAIGGDVVSAATSLGRALESPTFGMRALSAEGVTFTTQQRELIAELDRTGQAAKAQGIILDAVEQSANGAAKAVGDTLGGSFKRLGNALSELFKSEDTSVFVKAVDGITAAVNKLDDALKKFHNFHPMDDIKNALQDLSNVIPAVGQTGPGASPIISPQPAAQSFDLYNGFYRILQQNADDQMAAYLQAVKNFPEFSISAKAGTSGDDKIKDFNRQFLESLDTEAGKVQDQYAELLAKLIIAQSTKAGDHVPQITPDQAERVRQEFLDKVLPEFNTPNAQAANNARVAAGGTRVPLVDLTAGGKEKIPEKLSEQERELDGVIQDIGSRLDQLLLKGGVTARSITQQFVDAFESAAIKDAIGAMVSYIEKAISGLFSGNSGASTSGAAVSTFGMVLNAVFGRAGGGDFNGLTLVGENGPEYVAGRGRVYTPQQIQGGGATFAPNTTIVLNGPSGSQSDQKRLIAQLRAEMAENNRQQFNNWQTIMWNNGYGRLRT